MNECLVCGWKPTPAIPTSRLHAGFCQRHYQAWVRAGRPHKATFQPTKKPVSRAATSEAARRAAHAKLAANYGLTPDQYQAMWDEQQGDCAICGDSMEGEARCHIDHNHTTGLARGLLCSRCNPGLGHFRDDPELLARAVDYLVERGSYAEPMVRPSEQVLHPTL